MLSDLESRFVCKVCGKRVADMQPDLHWNKPVVLQLRRLLVGIKKGSSWNRVGKFEGLKGHRARYFRDILHFCGVQNLAQMLDGKNIETSSAALGYVFI